MRYFARDISTAGAIFLVDSRRINVEVLLRQCADGRGDWGGRQHPVRIFILSYFLILLHTYIYFASSGHDNLPNTTYAHLFCSPLPPYPQVRPSLFATPTWDTPPYPAEQQSPEGQFRTTKKHSSSTLCIHARGTIERCGWIKQG